MKKGLGLLLLLLGPAILSAQNTSSCCVAGTSTERFALFAHDPTFMKTHLDPLPFHYNPENGKWVIFKTADGGEGRAFEVESAKPTNNVILLLHEWWGLNDYIQRESENLQKELGNVTVLALDLYDKRIAKTRDDAGKYMGELKEDRAKAIIDGALKYLGSKARVATIGWCMGGGWSLQASLAAGKQSVACVIYYGMPEKNIDRLKTLNSPVLFIFASKDQWINKTVLEEFEKGMKDVKKSLEVKSYDADHAFANPSNPQFDKKAADDAHRSSVEFLRTHLLR